jgi:AcrR family transcriptional regulator
VIEAAMDLFAATPIEEVTIQDIANSAGMTPAAVYYHFASKEQILLEGMRQFSDDLLDEIRRHFPQAGDRDGLRTLLTQLLTWTNRRRSGGIVYFINSVGLNLAVEAQRREIRIELVGILRAAVRAVRGRSGSADAGVIAVALVSLIETSAASMLNRDQAYRTLSARRFAVEVGNLGDRIAGIPQASPQAS